MKYYKYKNGGVLALAADGSDDNFIKPSMVLMTQAEVDAHINPPKTLAQLALEAKQAKIDQVKLITVTTLSGKVFNGDEISQNRMSRAVAASVAGDSTQWRLADNSVSTVSHDELKEALLLAGKAMTAIWVA